MAVEIIQSIGPKELGPQKHIEGDKTQQQTGRPKSETSKSGDDVQISDRAKALSEEFKTLNARAQAPSENLQTRIETAKQRIASGFYFQDDVLGQIAGRILDSEPLGPATGTIQADEKVSADKIARAKTRAAEGFYRQNDVLKVTAEKIIKDLTA